MEAEKYSEQLSSELESLRQQSRDLKRSQVQFSRSVLALTDMPEEDAPVTELAEKGH